MNESQTVEFKQSWRDEYLKWLCGYANAQGGTLYVGRDDTGKVTGVENAKRLSEELPNKIRDLLGVIADVNILEENGLEYVEIVIQPSSFPVNYKGEYHYRTGSTKQLLTGMALTQFLMKKMNLKWDAALVDHTVVEDLDKESFDIFRREAIRHQRMTETDLKISNRDLLDHLGLAEDGKLKRAAVMLFHREPDRFYTGAYTKIGKFNGSEIEYMDEVHGSLMLQTDRVIELIYLKYLKARVSYEKDTRVETYPFPREALREALFNALCHSDWSAGVPVQIKIGGDWLSIGNACVFPEKWTAETLMQDHPSIQLNPDIARTFFRAGLVEAWGRGIRKICEACEAYGTPPPEYTVHPGDITVRFTALASALLSDTRVAVGDVSRSGTKSGTQSGTKSGIKSGTKSRTKSGTKSGTQSGTKSGTKSPTQGEILLAFAEPCHISVVCNSFCYTNRTKFRQKYINPLLEQGLLEMTIPDKPTSSLQKYRLTGKGKAWLAKEANHE